VYGEGQGWEHFPPGGSGIPSSKFTRKGKVMFGIGEAVKNLRDGKKIARSGWNGKNMYLELQVPDTHSKMTLPYVYMRTAQADLVPWLCSQTDLLATDWQVVEA
jgi:hypothetical protein